MVVYLNRNHSRNQQFLNLFCCSSSVFFEAGVPLFQAPCPKHKSKMLHFCQGLWPFLGNGGTGLKWFFTDLQYVFPYGLGYLSIFVFLSKQ